MTVAGTVTVVMMATGSRAATIPPPPATIVIPPFLTVTTQAPSTTAMAREPGVVRVASSCPVTTAYTAQPGTALFDEIVGAQSHLGSTIQQTQRYAATQPTFGDLRFGGPNNGFVIVSFTGDLQIHAATLSSIVDVPDGVIVCPATQTAAERAALANELVTL